MIEQTFVTLRNKLKDKTAMVEQLQAELDSSERTAFELEGKLNHLQRAYSDRERELKAYDSCIRTRDGIIEKLRADIKGHESAGRHLREELDRMNKLLNYRNETIQELRKDMDRSIPSLREDLKGRDDTIALLNKKIVEQADQIRTMQALAGTPWTYTPTQTFAEMPPADIAGNPVSWATGSPVAQIKATVDNKGVPVDLQITQPFDYVKQIESAMPLKFAPMPANDVDAVDLNSLLDRFRDHRDRLGELRNQMEQNSRDILSLYARVQAVEDRS